ncbi:two pore domain potassium channel family protein, partial [Streptomyces sp. LRa12]
MIRLPRAGTVLAVRGTAARSRRRLSTMARMPDTNTTDLWERRTQGPLLALAVLFAVAYALPVVMPDAPEQLLFACHVANWVVWAAFAIDYAVRLWLSEDRLRFVRSHPLALLAVLLPL